MSTTLAVRSGCVWDAGRAGGVGRRPHTRGRARPTVRAEAIAVLGGAERISSPEGGLTRPQGWSVMAGWRPLEPASTGRWCATACPSSPVSPTSRSSAS